MSLRDQLLKSGVVSLGDVRRVNQEQQSERQKAKGQRESREEAEARASAEAKRAREEREAQIIAARRARDREAEAAAARRRVSHLLRDYQMRTRGGYQPFWHRTPDGLHIHKMYVSERVAWDLLLGHVAIAWTGEAEDPTYVLLPAAVVPRVMEIDPGRILFFNASPAPRDDPAERLYEVGSGRTG